MRTLLATLFVLSLAACGQPASTPATSASATPPRAAEPHEDNEELQELVAALPSPYNEANYEAGRRVFGQCRSCHTIDQGAPNRVGPNLHSVFGREIGSAPGFTYSQAVQDADFIWDADHLDHWLQNPQTFLPGNRMGFAGVRDETQRRDLIAYLMVESER